MAEGIPTNKSKFCGYIRHDNNELTGSYPVDTSYVQENIVNNLDSTYNSVFQTLANVNYPTGSIVGGLSRREQVGPFPIRRLHTGEMAPIFIEVNAQMLTSSISGNIHFWLRPLGQPRKTDFETETNVDERYYQGGTCTIDGVVGVDTPEWKTLTIPETSQLQLEPIYLNSISQLNQMPTRLTASDSATLSNNPDMFFVDVLVYNEGGAALKMKLSSFVIRECFAYSGSFI